MRQSLTNALHRFVSAPKPEAPSAAGILDGARAAEAADTAIPYDLLMQIQLGTMAYTYKGIPTLKNPFDLALYTLLFQRVKPRSVIEIGSNAGGGAVWMADQLAIGGLDAHVYSMDIVPVHGVTHPMVTFLTGDGRNPGVTCSRGTFVASLPRPLVVIDDADHHYITTRAVMAHFAPLMHVGEYLLIEDGILGDMRLAETYGGGPKKAIDEFIAQHRGAWEIDRAYCDYFGRNVTWNVDGYLTKKA